MRRLLAIVALSLAAAGQDLKNLPSGGPPMDLAFQVGHTSWPGRFDVSGDGKRLVTASMDRVIVWERDSKLQTHVFDRPKRHPEQPYRFMHPVKFSPDGRHLFMWGTGIWDLTTQYYSARLPFHYCSAAVWSPDGRFLLTGSAKKKDAKGVTTAYATLWDARTGRRLHRFSQPGENITHVDWSADGKTLMTCAEKSCYAWDAASYAQRVRWHADWDGAILHPDGKRLLLWKGTYSHLARISDGKREQYFGFRWRRMKVRAKGDKEWKEFDEKPASWNMAPSFSPDGKLLVQYHAYEPHHTLAVWDVASRKVLHKLHAGNGPWVSGFTRDGKEFSILSVPGAGVNSLFSWNTSDWKRTQFRPRKEALAEIRKVQFRNNAELFVDTLDDNAMLLDLKSATRRRTFFRHLAYAPRLSRDGKQVIASYSTGAVLWDAETGRETLLETARPFDLPGLLFPNERQLITFGRRFTEKPAKIGRWNDRVYEGTEFVVWNRARAQIEYSFMLPKGQYTTVLSALGGRRIITGQRGRKILGRDGVTGKPVMTYGKPQPPAAREWDRNGTGQLLWPSIGTNPARTVLLGWDHWEYDGRKKSPRGEFSTVFWDIESGRRIGALKEMRPLQFSPDGSMLLMRHKTKKETSLWSFPSLRRIAVLGDITPAGFDRRSQKLIVRTATEAGLLDLKTRKLVQRFVVGEPSTTWYQPAASRLNALSPDQKRFVTVRNAGQAYIWDTASGRKLATLVVLNGGADWLIITPYGFYHGTEAARQFVAWRIEGTVFPVDLYNKRYHRPDFVAKVLRGEPLPKSLRISGAHRPPRLTIGIESIKHDHVLFRAVALPGSKGAKITSLQVYVDGRDIGNDLKKRILREERGGAVVFVGRIDFPAGKTKAIAAAVATDEYGLQSRPALEVIVRPGPATAAKRSLYVLTAGISKYRDRGSDLVYPASDSESLAKFFKTQEGLAFDKVFVRKLTNETATRARILAGIGWLRQNCGRSDVAVLHFGGHGYRDTKGRLYYVPHDADMRAPEKTLLSWDAVAKDLRETKASQMLFFSDCCHSGAFGRQALSQTDLVRTLLKEARMMVFASSRGSEVSYEMNHLKAGAFSYAIVQGLRGKADLIKDGRITVSELQLYVSDQVKKLTWDRQHPHIPRMNDFDPEMVIAHVK